MDALYVIGLIALYALTRLLVAAIGRLGAGP
jgi:hypothetical protein